MTGGGGRYREDAHGAGRVKPMSRARRREHTACDFIFVLASVEARTMQCS
jgi:hypothetical protein